MTANLITITQAAGIMAVSEGWVKGMIEKNELARHIYKGTTLVDADEIQAKGWAVDQEDTVPGLGNVTRMNRLLGVITLH